MYYPEEVIEEVRTRNDIVDIVSQYVNLKKKGANYFGLCPFHNEKSPSFSVSPSKQMYYCFIIRNPRPFPFHRESRCITASDAEQAEMSSPL